MGNFSGGGGIVEIGERWGLTNLCLKVKKVSFNLSKSRTLKKRWGGYEFTAKAQSSTMILQVTGI